MPPLLLLIYVTVLAVLTWPGVLRAGEYVFACGVEAEKGMLTGQFCHVTRSFAHSRHSLTLAIAVLKVDQETAGLSVVHVSTATT